MTDYNLLNTAELAELLHASKRTVIRWRQERIGPPWVRAGGKVLYRRSDVDQWLERRRVEPVREPAA